MKDIVDLLRENGYGVVEGKDEVLKKIDELSKEDFSKASKLLKKAHVKPPYKAVIAP